MTIRKTHPLTGPSARPLEHVVLFYFLGFLKTLIILCCTDSKESSTTTKRERNKERKKGSLLLILKIDNSYHHFPACVRNGIFSFP